MNTIEKLLSEMPTLKEVKRVAAESNGKVRVMADKTATVTFKVEGGIGSWGYFTSQIADAYNEAVIKETVGKGRLTVRIENTRDYRVHYNPEYAYTLEWD